jgi:hypothetical protein
MHLTSTHTTPNRIYKALAKSREKKEKRKASYTLHDAIRGETLPWETETHLFAVVEALEVVVPAGRALGGHGAVRHAVAEVHPDVVAAALLARDSEPRRHDHNATNNPRRRQRSSLLLPRESACTAKWERGFRVPLAVCLLWVE